MQPIDENQVKYNNIKVNTERVDLLLVDFTGFWN